MIIGRYVDITAPALWGRELNFYWDLRFLPDVAGMLVGARIPGVDPKFTPIMNTTLGMDVGGQNLAAAESVVLALITLVLSFGFLKYNQRKGAMA